ncbi:MAG: hypothetical protein O2913_03050 [Chloroflexi bacterium]|nr:hypothetical protein [Chloroflexota bacterium]
MATATTPAIIPKGPNTTGALLKDKSAQTRLALTPTSIERPALYLPYPAIGLGLAITSPRRQNLHCQT